MQLLDLASLPDIDNLKITSALVEQVRASTAKSKLQLSRISSLGTQCTTSVLVQKSLLHEYKSTNTDAAIVAHFVGSPRVNAADGR